MRHAGQGDLKGALASLMQLKGVGAATASAVLAAGMPDVPFMSDELLLVGTIISALFPAGNCSTLALACTWPRVDGAPSRNGRETYAGSHASVHEHTRMHSQRASVPMLTWRLLQDVIGEKKYTAAAFAQLVEKLKKKLNDGTETAESYEKEIWSAVHGTSQGTKPAKREKNSDSGTAAKVANKRQRRA